MEGGNLENQEKNPRSTRENQQTTLLTYDTRSRELNPDRCGERQARSPPHHPCFFLRAREKAMLHDRLRLQQAAKRAMTLCTRYIIVDLNKPIPFLSLLRVKVKWRKGRWTCRSICPRLPLPLFSLLRADQDNSRDRVIGLYAFVHHNTSRYRTICWIDIDMQQRKEC